MIGKKWPVPVVLMQTNKSLCVSSGLSGSNGSKMD